MRGFMFPGGFCHKGLLLQPGPCYTEKKSVEEWRDNMLLIQNAHVIDPASGRSEECDILVQDRKSVV